ncbi:NAD(P)-binding domain protein [Metarhizium rileyi]|uniref:NAD(P)-binding domain protein n=1 Tax=Metarhizium rileyi (strain RCEF 4871) TaxID=1649241 RepID=A0A167DZI6_METRR|nr:NAD(P)-binding domain protein [Metarhizium rileyi RCEF 4871]
MAPAILVAGATGNAGRDVVETLSALFPPKVLALTRDASGTVAQHLAALHGVQVVELS